MKRRKSKKADLKASQEIDGLETCQNRWREEFQGNSSTFETECVTFGAENSFYDWKYGLPKQKTSTEKSVRHEKGIKKFQYVRKTYLEAVGRRLGAQISGSLLAESRELPLSEGRSRF